MKRERLLPFIGIALWMVIQICTLCKIYSAKKARDRQLQVQEKQSSGLQATAVSWMEDTGTK